MQTSFNEETKTLTVTFGNETRHFVCREFPALYVADYAMSGKFRTGEKVWPLSLTVSKSTGRIAVSNGGYSNKGGVVRVVGFWNRDNPNNSKNY